MTSMFEDAAYPRELHALLAMTSALSSQAAVARAGEGGVGSLLAQQLDRPYRCPVPACDSRFHRKFTLHEHMKTHTGEKPHQCPVGSCGKRFSTSGNLARHRRLHAHSKLKCPVTACTRVFIKKEKLIRHLKVHMGSTTHTCVVSACSKTFSTAGNLTRHMKSQHPMVPVTKPRTARSATKSATGGVDRTLLPDRIIRGVPAAANTRAPLGASDASGSSNDSDALITPPSSPGVLLVASPVRSTSSEKISEDDIMELLDCIFVPGSPSSEAVGVPADGAFVLRATPQQQLSDDAHTIVFL